MASSNGENQPQVDLEESLKILIAGLQQKVKDQELLIQNLQWIVEQQGWKMKEQSEAQELEQKVCYCPYLMLTEEERAHRIIDLLWPDIAQVIKINEDLPTTMEDCFGRALCINQRMVLIKEKESKEDKAKGKQVNQGKKRR